MNTRSKKLSTARFIFFILCSSVLTTSVSWAETAKLEDGVYAHFDPNNTEIIELRGDRFRYWFSSDVKAKGDPEYPLSGKFIFDRGGVTLRNSKIFESRWRYRSFEGKPALWSGSALDKWLRERTIERQGILCKQKLTATEIWRPRHK